MHPDERENSRGTKSSKGRTVSIHPDEALMQKLRERQSTPAGRTQLRQLFKS